MPGTAAQIAELALERLTLDEWQAFVAGNPDSSAFHHEKWLRLLMDQYGFDNRILTLKRNGGVLAAVPFLETDSVRGKRKWGSVEMSMHSHYVAGHASTSAIVARTMPILSLAIRHSPPIVFRTFGEIFYRFST